MRNLALDINAEDFNLFVLGHWACCKEELGELCSYLYFDHEFVYQTICNDVKITGESEWITTVNKYSILDFLVIAFHFNNRSIITDICLLSEHRLSERMQFTISNNTTICQKSKPSNYHVKARASLRRVMEKNP